MDWTCDSFVDVMLHEMELLEEWRIPACKGRLTMGIRNRVNTEPCGSDKKKKEKEAFSHRGEERLCLVCD